MVETARPTSGGTLPTGERDAILHAMALAAQGLLAADDVQDLAGNVLASLGTATGASRVYVIKNRAGADGGLRRTLAFEWCGPGVTPQAGTDGIDVPWDGPWGPWAHLLRAGTPVLGRSARWRRTCVRPSRPGTSVRSLSSPCAWRAPGGDAWGWRTPRPNGRGAPPRSTRCARSAPSWPPPSSAAGPTCGAATPRTATAS